MWIHRLQIADRRTQPTLCSYAGLFQASQKMLAQTRCLINNYINYTGTAEWSMNKLNTLWIFTKDLFNIKPILTISDQIHKCHTRISFVSLQIVKTQTSLWTCAVLLQLSLYAEFLCLYMQCANSIESIQTMQMCKLVEPFAGRKCLKYHFCFCR